MRNQVPAYRSRSLSQAAIIALIAGSTAACSGTVERFNKPFFTGSTENQRAIIGSNAGNQPMPDAVPMASANTGVSRQDLPPPPSYATAPAYASAEEPLPMSAPAPQAAGPMSGGHGWTAVGGKVLTVEKGQTLAGLARRFDVPPSEILKANQLTSPAQLTVGRVVVIPVRAGMGSSEPVPVRSAAAAPVAMPQGGGATHTVGPGETLYGIASRAGVRVDQIIALNGLSSPEAIRVGQKLQMPGGATSAPRVAVDNPRPAPVRGPQVASLDPKAGIPPAAEIVAPAAPAVAAAPTAPVVIPADPKTATPGQLAAAAAPADMSADPPSANGTTFRWPVRGRIISGFGARPNGERNDGINLAVPEGTSVKAAEAGTVIYAGNELQGYGKLVLVRHAGGWVSAYAHNSEVLVKRGDKVNRGQTVARAGMSGSVTTPQVHFELRKGAKPVNPMDYLAGA